MNELIDWRLKVISDPESTAIMTEYMGTSDPKALKAGILIISQWNIYKNAFYSRRYGLMGDGEWTRFQRAIFKHKKSCEF